MKQDGRIMRVIAGLFIVICLFVPTGTAIASPFGQGVFGADIPFGSMTSISINLGGDVALNLLPSGNTFTGSGSHTVTVTSTDVVGYYLYAHTTGSTDMTSTSASIPASSNTSAGPLAASSWGYNTTGSSTNFLGMNASGVLLKDASGPFKNGDPTTITYGALTSGTQAAGSYSIAMIYTAVAKNQ